MKIKQSTHQSKHPIQNRLKVFSKYSQFVNDFIRTFYGTRNRQANINIKAWVYFLSVIRSLKFWSKVVLNPLKCRNSLKWQDTFLPVIFEVIDEEMSKIAVMKTKEGCISSGRDTSGCRKDLVSNNYRVISIELRKTFANVIKKICRNKLQVNNEI